MTYTLAFDIERAGATDQYDTIGIGCSVVDNNFNELDSLFLAGYFPKETKFETRCWDQFWSKNQETLKLLEYTGGLNYQQRQSEMTLLFQEFRKKWERIAKEEGHDLNLVSDNNVYDGGFMNLMINKYIPDVLPIPYTATTQEYESFFETTSELKGLLSAVNPNFKGEWGLLKKVGELYDLPVSKKQHNHNPADDAYTVAFEHQIVLGIRDGKIKRKHLTNEVSP